jgi:hypothetical protein
MKRPVFENTRNFKCSAIPRRLNVYEVIGRSLLLPSPGKKKQGLIMELLVP